MDTPTEFETLLNKQLPILERFIRYRIADRQDADDILQETCMAAFRAFDSLSGRTAFKSWLLTIARNKCTDYYRTRAARMEIPLDSLYEASLSQSSHGRNLRAAVSDTLDRLGDKDKQILYLCYFRNYPQEEIARRLKLPLGTVKSRLHYAKQNFRQAYPYPPKQEQEKGDKIMTALPNKLPAYSITPTDETPFPVKFEELIGWFIIPRMGEHITWGSYDQPAGILTESVTSEVTGNIMLHGIEGVEIHSRFAPAEGGASEHIYYAQLTDTHCRWLGESYTDSEGMKHLLTFLDGEEFMEQWGFGEDNCGSETNLTPKGEIKRAGNEIIAAKKKIALDVVGRYSLTLGEKVYDTVCIMMIYDDGALTEQYVDSEGRTVLWRRFNRGNWAIERYVKPWQELLPENERITVNGELYVHWYDCVTDRLF